MQPNNHRTSHRTSDRPGQRNNFKLLKSAMFFASKLVVLVCALIVFGIGCSRQEEISPSITSKIKEEILSYYLEKDKEIVVDFLKFSPEEGGSVTVLVKLTWPKFSVIGKKVNLWIEKQDDKWKVTEEKDV
ncbi:hypothetical protein KAW55_04470 [bacterium]|nr:hypothetical protein [bacterium]